MIAASLALGVLAIVLAWPVPIALARAGWPHRAPATALVLWQSIALAGGLSMIGALAVYGLEPFGATLPDAVAGFRDYLANGAPTSGAELPNAIALTGALLLAGHLVLNLVVMAARTEAQRRRHRQLIALLGSPMPDRPDTHLIDSPAPVAYCLPGTVRSVTVLSAGLIDLLEPRELSAVVEHERAHVDQRHYLVLLAFRAWNASLPWFPIASRAEAEVTRLVEMLADDRARREVDDHTVARAIALVAGGRDPDAGVAPTADVDAGAPDDADRVAATTAVRVRRLLAGVRPLSIAGRASVIALAAGLLVVPTALLVAP